jgi:hypothetical protein
MTEEMETDQRVEHVSQVEVSGGTRTGTTGLTVARSPVESGTHENNGPNVSLAWLRDNYDDS